MSEPLRASRPSLAEVAAFLAGSAPLDGAWFGEPHPTEPGAFWWRKHLRAALAEQQPVACPIGIRPERRQYCSAQTCSLCMDAALPIRETAEQPQPVAWADDCRLSLVTALHSLSSDFENALYKFDGDDEARRSASGAIAHARKVAARWDWNGAAPPTREPVRLTQKQIDALWMHRECPRDGIIEQVRYFARAVEDAMLAAASTHPADASISGARIDTLEKP